MTALPADAMIASTNQPTFIDILLDETGSMSSCHSATVTGFNAFVAEQREIEGSCYLTLTKFDAQNLKTPYQNLRIEAVPELTFFPGGGTNLYDVVGQRVGEVLRQNRQGRSLVVVITDGDENCSKTFRTADSVKAVISAAISQGVTFLYYGAGSRAKQTALAMGFPDNSIEVFDTRHMGETMKTASAKTRAFRVGA
jgi:hypothetical protein